MAHVSGSGIRATPAELGLAVGSTSAPLAWHGTDALACQVTERVGTFPCHVFHRKSSTLWAPVSKTQNNLLKKSRERGGANQVIPGGKGGLCQCGLKHPAQTHRNTGLPVSLMRLSHAAKRASDWLLLG